MEKELTAAEKGRKTRLSNMSVEELVNIILRKDKTEHKLQNLNKCLKENINGLENKINNLKAVIATLENTNVKLDKANREFNDDIKSYKDEVQHKTDTIDYLKDMINMRKRDLRRLVYIIIALGLVNIIQVVISFV